MDVLLSLLITLLILVVIYVVIIKCCAIFEVDAKIVGVIKLIFMVIALIVLLRVFGIWGGGPYYVWPHRP